MSDVKCPKCGKLMILRTARKGRYKGNQFYGCSGYPICKEIMDVGSSAISTLDQKPVEPQEPDSIALPRRLIARELYKSYQARFFESAAVPQTLLSIIRNEVIDEKLVQAFSQWRVDFPSREPLSGIRCAAKISVITSLAEKILSRGRLTLVSPSLEKDLYSMFFDASEKAFDEQELILAFEQLAFAEYGTTGRIYLDSDEEYILYEDIIPGILGDSYRKYVTPQIELLSLMPQQTNAAKFRRADFAIFTPQNRVVVEIYGKQHEQHLAADEERNNSLREQGYAVVTIPAEEVRKRSGPNIESLSSLIAPMKNKIGELVGSAAARYIESVRLAHQIQRVILLAIQEEFLNLEEISTWRIAVDFGESSPFSESQRLSILNKSVKDLMELLRHLGKLLRLELPVKIVKCVSVRIEEEAKNPSLNSIYIDFRNRFQSDSPTFHIQSLFFPFHIANSSLPQPNCEALEPTSENDLEYFLKYLFRKDHFWKGQIDGIIRTMEGKDTLLLLPTGGGKSLVYQLASFLLPGQTIVIDPIISLMDDQIYNLAMIGIDRCIAVTSQLNSQDRERVVQLFAQGEYLFAFVAPERFQTEEFRESLRTLTTHTAITAIVIDEAHCVSEWGHDFRTAYLNIGRTSRNYCQSGGIVPPLLGLTGTASRAVLKDIQRELQISDFSAIITPSSFDRPELKFGVIHCSSSEKAAILQGFLGKVLPSLLNTSADSLFQTRGDKTYSGLVFCTHVNGEFGVVELHEKIGADLSVNVEFYAGSAPHGWEPREYIKHKLRVTKDFKRNHIPLLFSTKAYAMGIDKPNVRYTVHYNVPPSIEAFYQEAGRAGRDRQPAYCYIIASNDNLDRTERLLNEAVDVVDISSEVADIPWAENDDITRLLFFHSRAFRGIAKEKEDIERIFQLLGGVSVASKRTLVVEKSRITGSDDDSTNSRMNVERALHRLLLIGVVSDYTVDYSKNEFHVLLSGKGKDQIIESYAKYVAGYHRGRSDKEVEAASKLLGSPISELIIGVVDLLLHFIYDIIERGRRRALREMLLTCSISSKDKDIRKRINDYLETTEFSENLESLVTSDQAGIACVKDIIADLRSPNEAGELRGQTARYLGSYPDHPGLLMVRSLSEMLSRDRNPQVVRENFIASLSSAVTKYSISKTNLFQFISWAILTIIGTDIDLGQTLIKESLRIAPDRILAKTLVAQLPSDLCKGPAWYLLAGLREECMSLLSKGDL